MTKCMKHKHYTGVPPPCNNCEGCWAVYLIRNPNTRCMIWRVLESIEFNRSEDDDE
jgi:hypothetical protein